MAWLPDQKSAAGSGLGSDSAPAPAPDATLPPPPSYYDVQATAGRRPWTSPPDGYDLAPPERYHCPSLHGVHNKPSPPSSSSWVDHIVPQRPQPKDVLPVVIPQNAVKVGLDVFAYPFQRAYAPQLANNGVGRDVFLKFIDGLNEAFLGSSALQAVNLVGTVTSFVPHHIPQLVGGLVSFGANVGRSADSMVRTKKYMVRMNEELFAPRGLVATVMNTSDMLIAANLGQKQGGLKNKLPLHELTPDDLSTLIENGIPSRDLDPQHMRLKALEGFIAPLDFHVPEENIAHKTFLKKMNAKASYRLSQKQQEKRTEELKKAQEKLEEMNEKIAKENRSLEKVQARMDLYKQSHDGSRSKSNKLFELQDDLEKAISKRDAQVRKHRNDYQHDAKDWMKGDEKSAKRLRWVVIYPRVA